jgi:cold shock protein
METGTIKFFDARVSNFGFIVPDKTGPEIFLHGNAVPDLIRKDLTDGRRVRYRVEPDKRGRPRATYSWPGSPRCKL